MTAAPPLARYSAIEGALTSGFANAELHHLSGHDQDVGPKAATALALVFHETATNAVKYGALSAPNGRITVTCDTQPAAITICWKETGGPSIETKPERRGFGSFLAERIARSQLDATLEREWLPDGLEVSLRIPSERLAS